MRVTAAAAKTVAATYAVMALQLAALYVVCSFCTSHWLRDIAEISKQQGRDYCTVVKLALEA